MLGQKSLMLKVNMSNGHVTCQQLLPESSRLAVPQTLTMDKVNVVLALSTLSVAPNTKGREKSTKEATSGLTWEWCQPISSTQNEPIFS